ncbi:MAG: response regulator transcription factor [Clostridiaceae bacterium]|nr:response regulator transcription factor [Clostridiaceae bacterium]
MKILIVEDEISLASALEHILREDGHFTDMVNDGLSALEYIYGFSYDLILLDVMLPRMDGFEVVRQIREKKISTPVLILTARTAIPDKVAGLNFGADDYMEKPFDPAELLARVHAMTRRVGDVVMKELCFEDLTLRLETAQLFCQGESVQLSRKEFEVARFLLSNPHMTVTKEVLIVNVWGIDSEATDNNVEAYISFLRKKLKYLKSTVSIRNIQRIGYRLEAGQ